MAKMSYLIQQLTNQTLDLIEQARKDSTALPNDLELSRQLEVSRTSIRSVINHLIETGVLEKNGTVKTILRAPKAGDYFDISNEYSSKEALIEDYFLSQINTGQLMPGHRFSELELAKKSGCNTITVREFLIRFSHTGLIQKKPRAQWQMVEFDENFARELVEFRSILEMKALRTLLERPSDDPIWKELKTLLNEHKELQLHIETRYNDFPKLDARLHRTLLECTGNRFINQFFDIVTFVCHYHYQWDKSDEKKRNTVAVAEHIDLLTKLLARDIADSIMSLEAHLNTAQTTLMRSAHGLNE
jgi:DNA-binding GntR family transcriptional regulator